MTEQAITEANVEAISDDTRKEIVAKRQAGVTLAELRKQYPQLTSDQIRDLLPPANARERKAKATPEPKPAAPKPRAAKPTQTAAMGQAKPKPSAKAQAAGNGQAKPTDKAELRLAQQVVKMRETDGMSWAPIGFKLKLVPADAKKQTAGGAARRLYKLVRGADADTSRQAITK